MSARDQNHFPTEEASDEDDSSQQSPVVRATGLHKGDFSNRAKLTKSSTSGMKVGESLANKVSKTEYSKRLTASLTGPSTKLPKQGYATPMELVNHRDPNSVLPPRGASFQKKKQKTVAR